MVSTIKTPVAPQFTQPILSAVADAGDKVTLQGRVEGYPEPSIKWYKNGSELFRSDVEQTLTAGHIVFALGKSTEKDSGRYTCTARNAAGTASSTADISVKGRQVAPHFVTSLQAQVVKAGERVEMTVEVSGVPTPEVTWHKNGQLVTKKGGLLVKKDGDTSTLIIPQAKVEDTGKFMVKAVNGAGEAHSVADFVVEQEFAPSQHPQQQVHKFSSKQVTMFEEKKQTVSKVSTSTPQMITLPKEIDKVERTVLRSHTQEQETPEQQQQGSPDLPKHTATASKVWQRPKTEQATIELSLPPEPEPCPSPQSDGERSGKVPPPPPPKPARPPPAVYSESEDEFVRKELHFEHPVAPLYSTTKLPKFESNASTPVAPTPPGHGSVTPTRFVPIATSPAPPEDVQPAARWKPTGDQTPSGTWKSVKPPPATTPTPIRPSSTPVHHHHLDGTEPLPPSQFEDPVPASFGVYRKSVETRTTTTTSATKREFKTTSSDSPKPLSVTRHTKTGYGSGPATRFTPTAAVQQPPSPPMPEPGPPPEFGYVDPKTVTRPSGRGAVVPPPPPTPTSMPKGGVAVYPGIPGTPPALSSGFRPVFPKSPLLSATSGAMTSSGSSEMTSSTSSSVWKSVTSTSKTMTSSSSSGTSLQQQQRTMIQQSDSGPASDDLKPGTPPEIGFAPPRDAGSRPESAAGRQSVTSPVPAPKLDGVGSVWSSNLSGSSGAPVFVKPLQDRLIVEGERAQLECIVQGDPVPDICWFRNGERLQDLPGLQSMYQLNVCALSIPETMARDEAEFTCVATNPAGSAKTTAILKIKVQGMVIQSQAPPRPTGAAPPTFEKVPQNCRFVQGGNALFELKVRGNPKPQVSWTRRGTPVVNSHKFVVHHDENTGVSSLQINQLQKEDEGEYTCSATNSLGEAVFNVLIQSDMSAPVVRQLHGSQQVQQQQQQQHTTQQQERSTFRQTRTVERKVASSSSTVTSSSHTVGGQTTFDQRVTHQYEFDSSADHGAPHYYTNGTNEGFKVDTFEYRLLQEIDFRESKTKRIPGEVETDAETDTGDSTGPPSPPQLPQRIRNSKLLEGSDATFQAKVTGNPKARVTWFKNGIRILPSQRVQITHRQQTSVLHIHLALPEDAGHYTLLAENSLGRVACSAQLVIEAVGVQDELQLGRLDRFDQTDASQQRQIRTPIYIPATEPVDIDQTANKSSLRPTFGKVPTDKEVTEGKMVRFDCRVTGRPYPEVLWFLNGKQVLDDTTHKLIVNEAGNHSLLITSSRRTDAGNYTCISRNKGGEASFNVSLIVIEREQVIAPKFVERFQTSHVHEGEPVSLHCRAVGTPVPGITWQKDGVQIHSTKDCSIRTDGGSSSLNFARVRLHDSAWYQCTAQNSAGSTATRARLFVEQEHAPVPEPWRLTLPKPTRVIQPEGSPEREIIWLRHVERAQHYQSHPEEEQRIATKPMFTHRLRNLTDIQEGDRAHFEARLIPIGDPNMTVEWYFNGKPLPASSRFMTSYRFGYVSLTILHVYSQDQGTYTCRAINELGEDITTCTLSVIARIRVEYASQHPESLEKIQMLEEWERYHRQVSVEEAPQKPVFVQPLRNLGDLQENQFAHFEAKLTPLSDPTMKVEWYHNNKPMTASSRVSTIYSFGYVALNIMHLRIEDSGTYTCRAINRAGEAVSTATLTVTVRTTGTVTETGLQEQKRYIERIEELESYQKTTRKDYTEEEYERKKPEFVTQIKEQINIMEGQSAHFEAKLQPVGDPNLKVEWFLNNKPLEASSRITTFFNFGYVALTIKFISEYDVGVYTCKATNKLGTAVTTAKLTIITKSNIALDCQHPEGLEKIRHLEDSSRYGRQVLEETFTRQLPRFTVPLQGNNKLVEGQAAHFEARLEPVNDSTMKVEWFLNGEPLQSGHRYKTYFDFGYVALDILYVFPEDTGLYTVKATNSVGNATQTSELTVQAKSSVDTSAIHQIGLEKIQHLEDSHCYYPHYDIEEISRSKPVFKLPLKDLPQLKENDHIHLECRLEPVGDPTMRVEWFFNGRPLTIGSRFKTLFDFGYVALDISNAYPEDSGEYTVRATNHLGSAHTSSCVHIIGKQSVIYESQHPAGLEAIHNLEDLGRHQRPSYEDRPINQMPTFTRPLHNVDTVEDNNVHLECRLHPVGDPNMVIEWTANGKQVPTGHRFRPAYDFDYVALDIIGAYAEDSGVYTCRAVNKLGEAVTSGSVRVIAKKAIILESQHPEGLEKIQYLEDSSRFQRDMWTEEIVKVHPRFLTKFKDLENLREGQNAHFECRLEPITDPNLKVEWFKNGRSLTIGHRFRPIHDFGYVALDILGVVEEDSGIYTCRATNMVGSEEMTVKLGVTGGNEIVTESQHPEGLEKIHYLEESQRYFREEISEEVSTQPPVFTSSIQNINIKESQRAHFECRLIPVSDPNLRVEWFCNGVPVKSGSRFIETHNFGYVALDIMTTYPEDCGTYSCKATNPLGTAVTTAVLKCTAKRSIYLESQNEDALQQIQRLEDSTRYYREPHSEDITTQAPVFTQAPRDLRLVENQSAHFECRLIPVGDPKLKVEWFRNGISLEAGTRVLTMHDFGFVALDLKYVRPDDSGMYTCKATNELGTAETSATLVVLGKGGLLLETQHPEGLEKIRYLEDSSRYQRVTYEEDEIKMAPRFVTPLTGPTDLDENQSSHYECRIEPHTDPNLKVEWFFNGKPLVTKHRFMSMFDFGYAALDILHVNPEDSGEYKIVATNKIGTASSSIIIRIKGKKSIILDSANPEGLPKIAALEDASGYQRALYEETPINEKPQFLKPLRNLERLQEGQSAHLESTVTPANDPSMKVEWFCNGRPITTGHRFRTTYDFGYVSLDLLYAYPEDSGTYMCKATNNNGEAIATCHINVEAARKIYSDTMHEEGLRRIQELESTYVPDREEPATVGRPPEFVVPLTSQHNLRESDRLHLECRLEPINDPKLKVEWFINGVDIKQAHRFRMTHDFGYVALDILYSYPEDSGTFMCKATNDLGEAVTTCSVQIQSLSNIYFDTQHPEGWQKIQELENQPKYEPLQVADAPATKPLFLSPLTGTTDLLEGQQCHLECRVEPVHDPQLTIEFTHNGKPLTAASRFHITFDFGYVALDISHVFPEDEGEYKVTAKNLLGQASSSIVIRVRAKSSIISDTQHPEGLEKIRELEDESRHRRPDYVEPVTAQRPVFTVPLTNLDNLSEGDSAHFEARLIPVGDPKLKVEWFFNEKKLPTSSRFRTVHDFGYVALDIQYVRPGDAGVYMCRATNDLGEAVTTASMKIKSKANIVYDSANPEGLAQIQALEDAQAYRPPEAPERQFEKPVFTSALTGPTELNEGQPALYECRVTPVGDPNLKFEWYVNGIELQRGTRFKPSHDFGLVTLEIAAVIPEDAGVYMCKASNYAGEAISSISLRVHARRGVLSDPIHEEGLEKTRQFEYDNSKIPEQWADQPSTPPKWTVHLNNVDRVTEGQSIHIEGRVVPVNDEKLKLEWFKNGKTLTIGTRMRTMLDFGLVSLDITGSRGDDSGIYTCRVYNDVGEAVSTCTVKVTDRHWLIGDPQYPASIDKIRELEEKDQFERPEYDVAYEGPVFISHLNNVETHEGDMAHFKCKVEPAKDPNMKIEFFINGQPMPLAARFTLTCDFGVITLDVSHTIRDDEGIFMCRATNDKGSASTSGSLKVHTGEKSVFYETQHPMGQAGLDNVLQAEQDYLAKYQQPSDQDSDVFYPKPTFIVPLEASFVVPESSPHRIECRVEPAADPKLTVEWFFNGKPLDMATRYTNTFEFGHVVLDVTDLWPRDSGIYTCRAQNLHGEAFTSTTIHVVVGRSIFEETVHPKGQEGLEAIQDLEDSLRLVEGALPDEDGHPPVFTSQFENLTGLVEGDIAHFEASLTPAGDQTMVVEWFFRNQPLKAGHRIRTVHAFGMVVLEILGVYLEDTGEYTCRATNRWGRAEITVRLECIDLSRGQKPVFTTHLQSLINLNEGDSAHFECNLIPVGDPAMVVEWFHNGRPLRHSSRIKTLSDFGYVVMDIAFVHPEDSGEYVCKAHNKYGEDTTRCTIKCKGRGTLFFDSLQPQSLDRIAALEGVQYTTQAYIEGAPNQPPKYVNHISNLDLLIEGQGAHFEASLTPVNDPNLTVEWYFNGKKLQTGHRFRTFHDFGIVILDILYCYEEDSGVYEARAVNRFGSDVTRATLKCKSKKNLIFDTQLPRVMEGGLDKIQELEDSYYRSRKEITVDGSQQPPVFVVPLQNVTDLRESENAHLEARLIPVDDPDLTVEWFFNNKKIMTASRIRTIHDFGFVVLEISPVYGEDSGEYSCRAKNRLGEAVTTCTLRCEGKRGVIYESQLPRGMEAGVDKIAQLESYSDQFISESWTDHEEAHPPQFVTQPQDLALMENSLAHFECRLTPVGDPSLKVEWFHNGKPLTAGSRVKTIHDFGFVILEVSGVYQRDAGLYTCKAANKHGEASVSCKLSVKGRLGVIMEPQLPSDFKSGTESIQKLEDSLHHKEEKVAEDESPRPPKFITQIQDLPNVNENEPVHFECRVEPVGDPTMRIEWFHNGRPLDTGSRVHTVEDFGFIVLDFDWTFPRDSGEYICRATNIWGSDMTKARMQCKGKRDVIIESQLPRGMNSDRLRDLECPPMYNAPAEDTPLQPPKFITQIQPLLELQEGDSAHFDCKLIPVNDPKLKVEWFHNGKPLMSGHRFKTTHDFDYVALDILYTYAEDSGEYLAKATNDLGQDVTKTALQCKGGLSIILYNQMPREMKKKEAYVQLEATLRKYTQDIKLTEDDIFDPDRKQPPKFITQIQSQTDLKEFQTAKFECQLAPVGDPHMKVEWFFNGRPLAHKNRFNPIYDFGFVALDFGWVYPEDSGEYICRATNLYGTDETRAVLRSVGKPLINYETQLPKVMKGGLQRIRDIEEAWIRTPEEEEEGPRERQPPFFVLQLEPQNVMEGTWAKFWCRITGYPRARVMWLINGQYVTSGSRYKLSFDGMHHLDIPRSRQYDAGKVEVIARNSLGEAKCATTLEVRPKHDDYRAVLKASPRPWYDTDLKVYQEDRVDLELERKYEESLGELTSQIFHTEDLKGGHKHLITPVDRAGEKSELDKAFLKRRLESEAYYKSIDGNIVPADTKHISIVQGMAKDYDSLTDAGRVQIPGEPVESMVHGKEIHTQKQTQTQKELKGDVEITRKTTVTETVEQEHKGVTKERVVKGPVPESKPPVFTKKIQPCRVFEKESGRFECEFSGDPAPTVTWYRENFPIKNSHDFQINSTDKRSVLFIREVFLEDSGVFTVVAENRGGSAKSTSNLVVEERKERRKGGTVPPSFTVTIQDVTVKAGQLARLDAKLAGTKPMDVYWLKGGKKVIPDIRYKILEEEDVYTLLIIEALMEDNCKIECVALNQGGEARCQAQLQVIAPSPKLQRPEPKQAKPGDIRAPSIVEPLKDQTVTEGQAAVFRCRVSANPAPTVKWFRGNNVVKQSRYFRMSEEGDTFTLNVSEAFPEDEGTYKCVLSNSSGSLNLSAHLSVLVPESATVSPTVANMENVTVREGLPARFVTNISGTPTPTVQWSREGVQIPQSTDFQMSQEGTCCTLLIANTYREDSGRYTCRATNPSGQAEASAYLRVESKN